MFRYTVIDVGGDLVVFNKEDGALAQGRRDSWPPRFPTEEEVKYERVRLKTERLARQARLEEDIRKKRLQTISNVEYNTHQSEKLSENDHNDEEEHDQSSEDSGIVSFRDDEQASPTVNITMVTTLDTTEEVRDLEQCSEQNNTLETGSDWPARNSRTTSVKSRTVSVKSLRTQDTIPTDNVSEGPGDRPYIVAPGRRRAVKPPKNKKSGGCCIIL